MQHRGRILSLIADAAIVDDTMSPAPMPAAATSSPGPPTWTTLVRGAAVF